jgi:ubiquinone/menaquinone biosynthesis C-methylase UbiE
MGSSEWFRQSVRGPEDLAQEITVEVGCGPRGLILDADAAYLQRFKENSRMRYVGVDINQGYIDEVSGMVDVSLGEQLGQATERIEFRQGSATALPFLSDGAVAEMIFHNVFGEPRVSKEDKQAMVREAFRVLRNEGTATIVEDITPQVLERHHVIPYATGVFGQIPDISTEAHGKGLLAHDTHAVIAVFTKRATAR